ncbi:MAG TPA: MFS transporter [Candidatus Acidoferrales bacterium]|nr:MFS transporter [Candidatus Acidoferrales bacterium]
MRVVCLGTFFHIQSIGSINVSLAAIQEEFGASLAAVQWIGLMGAIMLCSFSLSFARAGDLVGRRKIFRLGLVLYTLGAGLVAASESFTALLAWRVAMALGLAMAAPLAGAIVASVFQHERRGRALGALAAAIALGRASGPTIGGLILQYWGCRGVFLANFLFGIPTCLVLYWVLRGPEERLEGSLDLPGALTLAVGFPALVVALSLGARAGWGSAEILLWLGVSAGGLAAFVYRELRARSPLMKLSYLRDPPLARALLSLVLATMTFYPVSIFGPLYLRHVVRAAPLSVGLAMATLPLCTTLLSPLSGRIADRFDGRRVAFSGLWIILLGMFLYARLNAGSTLTESVFVMAVIGAGIGIFVPANEKAAFSAATARDYGMLSAMLTAFGTGAGALGTALAVALAEAGREDRAIAGAAEFAARQQFAFSCMLPLALAAVAVTLLAKAPASGGAPRD